jgi:hypothetical protein
MNGKFFNSIKPVSKKLKEMIGDDFGNKLGSSLES